MNAEIITIGDELLIGQTIDTNSAWIGKTLTDIGMSISRKTAVQDNRDAIVSSIQEAFTRTDLVLMTGGLGPTKDDITKKTLADMYNCGYRRDASVVQHLEDIFAKRGRNLLETNLMQADLPEKCQTLFNARGTAPGMWFDENGKVLISMPGVPNEMMKILENEVIPRLQKRFITEKILHRTAMTVNIAESLLSKRLEDFENALPESIKLAYLPALNSVKLRLSCYSADDKNLQLRFDELFENMCSVAGEYLFAKEDIQPARYIASLLIENKLTFSLAESCTAGFIANQMMLQPGISAVMNGSLITYSNAVKHSELGVPMDIFTTEGAVSESCARFMVEGIQKKFNADLAISTTGIAGPGGATPEKPVGLIFIGVKYKDKPAVIKKFHLFGNREQFMQRACNCAMMMVLQELKSID